MDNFRQIEESMKNEMQDILYPYVKKVCAKLSEIEETLELEEKIQLEKLKCSIKVYELENEVKGRRIT